MREKHIFILKTPIFYEKCRSGFNFFLEKKGQILFWKMQNKFYNKKMRIRFLLKNRPDFCFKNCRTDFFLKKKNGFYKKKYRSDFCK